MQGVSVLQPVETDSAPPRPEHKSSEPGGPAMTPAETTGIRFPGTDRRIHRIGFGAMHRCIPGRPEQARVIALGVPLVDTANACYASLLWMGLERIPLYQLHHSDDLVPFAGRWRSRICSARSVSDSTCRRRKSFWRGCSRTAPFSSPFLVPSASRLRLSKLTRLASDGVLGLSGVSRAPQPCRFSTAERLRPGRLRATHLRREVTSPLAYSG